MAITFEKQYKYIMDRLPKEDNDLLEKITTNNRAFAMGRIFEGKASSEESLGLYNLFVQNMIIVDLLSRIYEMQYEEYAIKHEIRERKLQEIQETHRKQEALRREEEEKALAEKNRIAKEQEEKLFKEKYSNTNMNELKTAKDILNWIKVNNVEPYNTPELLSELEKIVRREMLYGNNRAAAVELLQQVE